MEPVTHLLTGACIGRAGFNRLTACATLAATLAAEAPDLDLVWNVAGPVAAFEHHRGITHTLLGSPFVALAVTALVWIALKIQLRLWDRLFPPRKFRAPRQPVRWFWVFAAAWAAALSHILLDWTNNYGVRPLFPFNARWYSGDLVFIAEPVLWLLLAGALIVPALLGLADRELGSRPALFRGRGWAIAALAGMTVLWCWRWAEHAQARNLLEAAQVTPTPARRIALAPYPLNPWRWHAILETETAWQTAEVDTRTGSVASDARVDSLLKPQPDSSVAFARQTRLGRVFTDWSQWPVVRNLGQRPVPGFPAPAVAPSLPWSAVQFADLRYAYDPLDTSMMGGSNQQLDPLLARSGLTGWVYVLSGTQDGGQFLQGRKQK